MSNPTNDDWGNPVHTQERKAFPEGPKKGENVHRILPPLLNQKESGKYVISHTCHYGYGLKREGSDKEFPNPFYCVEEGQWVNGKFVVTQECPECKLIAFVKGQRDAIVAKMKDAQESKDAIAKATESHEKWLRKHNRDFKQYVNVMDISGRFFTAKYPGKEVWKKVKAFIEEYKGRSIPIDAVAANQGLWFRIVRSGDGFKTEYSVNVVTEDVVVNGQVVPGAQQPKKAPLTREHYEKAKASCMDLADVGIKRLSIADVERLARSKGDPAIIEAVFASSQKAEPKKTTAPVEESPIAEEPERDVPDASPAAAPAATQTIDLDVPSKPVTAPPVAASSQDLLAQARALMEAAKVKQAAEDAATKAPAPEQKAAPKPAAPAPSAPTAPMVNTDAGKVKPPEQKTAPATSSAQDDFLAQFDLPQ
jgi:hypothetical protein